MKRRRLLSLLFTFLFCAASSICIVHSDPALPAHSPPDKAANLVHLLLIGPVVFLMIASSYAVVLCIWIMARAEVPLARLIDGCSKRISDARPLLTLWGLALVVLIFAVAVMLFRSHILGFAGVLLLIAGLALSGVGLASSAAQIGDRWGDAAGELELPLGSRIGRGLTIVAGVSVVPVVGWIVAVTAALGGVGAVAEYLVLKRR